MNETDNKKNIYAIILLLLNLTNLIVFFIVAYQTFASTLLNILGFIASVLLFVTFFYTAIVVNRKVSKKYSIFLVLDVLLIMPGIFILTLGSFKVTNSQKEQREINEISEALTAEAEISNIKRNLYERDYYFYDERCISAGIRCIDKDNKIKKMSTI